MCPQDSAVQQEFRGEVFKKKVRKTSWRETTPARDGKDYVGCVEIFEEKVWYAGQELKHQQRYMVASQHSPVRSNMPVETLRYVVYCTSYRTLPQVV